MIDGVDIIFIVPPVALIIIALVFGVRRFSQHGAKSGITSVVRIIVYGSFILFVLFLVWVGMYYAGGGH